MHIMTRWVCVCVRLHDWQIFPYPFLQVLFLSQLLFLFSGDTRKRVHWENTHNQTHKKYFWTHTQVLPLSCSWPSLRFNWLLAGPNPTNTNTQARTHFLSQEKRQAEKRQNDGIDDWRGGTEEEIGKGGNFPISHWQALNSPPFFPSFTSLVSSHFSFSIFEASLLPPSCTASQRGCWWCYC